MLWELGAFSFPTRDVPCSRCVLGQVKLLNLATVYSLESGGNNLYPACLRSVAGSMGNVAALNLDVKVLCKLQMPMIAFSGPGPGQGPGGMTQSYGPLSSALSGLWG